MKLREKGDVLQVLEDCEGKSVKCCRFMDLVALLMLYLLIFFKAWDSGTLYSPSQTGK